MRLPEPNRATPGTDAPSIARALSVYADGLEEAARGARPARRASLRQVVALLAGFAATVLVLDSGGLMTWARRLEVGRTQAVALATLTRWHAVVESVGLDRPRRRLLAFADDAALAAGAGEDPLLARGWIASEDELPATVPSSEADEPGLADVDGAPASELESPAVLAPPSAAPPTGPSTILLVGDSMLAGSLGSAIQRVLGRDSRLRVVSAVQTATGLSRPDVFDWMKVTPQLLMREQPRFVVCSFGANDAADLREGDEVVRFGTPRWRRITASRVESMMRLLAGERTRVLWLGLPPMRSPHFSERARWMNLLASRAARKVPRVEYFELGMLVSGADGRYTTFLQDERGRFVRLRLDDGVHYSPQGARRVARWVADWTYERLGLR